MYAKQYKGYRPRVSQGPHPLCRDYLIISVHTAGVSTLLAGIVLLVTRLIAFRLHTPMTLVANLLSIPVEVSTLR